jgi:hypothetical protein
MVKDEITTTPQMRCHIRAKLEDIEPIALTPSVKGSSLSVTTDLRQNRNTGAN